MGKDQDLLEAARTGNITVIEKILNLRSKKSGPLGFKLQGAFDSLRRPTNLNCQDGNGYTPLHLASLNGQRQVVTLLLSHEASANIIDNKGCQALYWAAWNGYADICRELLSHGPSFANVNEQNHEGDTALLCGAQYGHTAVIDVLLEHNAECSVRNSRGESALDLACQYGRTETVRLLLDRKPQLVSELQENVSALHLASRNGHKVIVQLLIERGFDVNVKTETGSALHEAALCGKEDVVLFLLEKGIDVYLKDSNDRSAVEVLSDHKSQKSVDIGNTILDHLQRLGLSPTKPRPASSSLPYLAEGNPDTRPLSELYSTPVKVRKARDASRERLESETTSSQLELPERTSRGERPSSDPIYDVPQPHPTFIPKGKSPSFSEGSFHSPHGSPSSLASSPARSPKSRHDVPKKPPRKKKPTGSHETSLSSLVDTTSIGGGSSPREFPHDSPKIIHVDGSNQVTDDYAVVNRDCKTRVPFCTQDSGDYVSLASVTAEAKRIATLEQQQQQQQQSSHVISMVTMDINRTYTLNCDDSAAILSAHRQHSEDPDDKNPVFDESDKSPNASSQDLNESADENRNCKENFAMNGKSDQIDGESHLRGEVVGRDVSGTGETEPQGGDRKKDLFVKIPQGGSGASQSDSQSKENADKRVSVASSGSSSRPVSLEFSTPPQSSQRSSLAECPAPPLSPTGYKQPPTPDFPPPSPSTAVRGIHSKIQPKLPERRLSRDMETITEQEYLHQDGHPLPAKTTDCQTDSETSAAEESMKTAEISQPGHVTGSETVIMRKKSETSSLEDILTNEDNPFFGLSKGSIPAGQRRVKSQIYENVVVHPVAKLKKRLSTPGISSNFDPSTFEPVPERDELLQRSTEGSDMDVITGDTVAENAVKESCDNNENCSNVIDEKYENRNNGNLVDTDRKLVQSDTRLLAQSATSSETESERQDTFEEKTTHERENNNCNMAAMVTSSSREGGEEFLQQKQRESLKNQEKTQRLDDAMTTSMDESDEWAQISDLIRSAGGRMSTAAWQDMDFYEQQLQRLFAKEKGPTTTMQSVGDWLESLGLPQYENTFIANGYDDMEFMGCNVLEYTDLVELGITEEEHVKKILDAAKVIPPVKHIGAGAAPRSVDEWLDNLQLPEYLQTFRMNGFHTVDRVQNVWELELNSVLDTAAYGHKRRILASLRSPDSPRKSTDSQDLELLQKVGFSCLPEDGVAEENLFKDYTKPLKSSNTLPNSKTRSQTLPTPVQRSRSANDTVLEPQAAIDIRPPNSTQVRQWRHRPEVLIKGCCNYNAQYLGSTLVKNLAGLESTKESIARMKKSTAGIGKIPMILLSISYKGVKFIDAKSKKVICEHEISNIFCACQDGDNLNHFAYITKDLQTAKLYCHVFSVKNTDLATEIILTLGEAFEVAYQMALREEHLQTSQNSTQPGATPIAANGDSKQTIPAETDV